MMGDNANRRRIFRVEVAAAEIDLWIGDVSGWRMLDCNSEGFGARAVKEVRSLRIGGEVSVWIAFEGTLLAGRAVVRNMCPCRSSWRYGLSIPAEEEGLRRGLRQLAVSVQRQRLKRFAARK